MAFSVSNIRACLLWLWLFCTATGVHSFNSDHRSYLRMTASSDADPDSHFGFSIVHHTFSNGELGLVVGAPLDTSEEDSSRRGSVYRCPVSSDSVCTRIRNMELMEDQYSRSAGFEVTFPAPPGGDSQTVFVPTGRNFSSDNVSVDGQLLGYTVFESDGLIGACAPKYLYGATPIPSRGVSLATGLGRCVVLEDTYSDSTVPLYQWRRDRRGQPEGRNLFLSGVDALISKQQDNLFIVGEPLGGFALSSPQDPSGRLMAQRPIANHSTVFEVPAEDDGVDSYLGYKVLLGNFMSTSSKQLATSSPRSRGHKGNIVFFSLDDPSDPLMRVGPGTNLGQSKNVHDGYYGYDFAAVKVTVDGYDSLVVGCPLCNGERGSIFFHRNSKGSIQQSGIEIQSPLEKDDPGRFGMSVTNIGDVDMDGFEDIAVGAPYSSGGKGAVYIYRGTEGGLFRTFSQRLDPPVGQSGHFGYAITGGFHYDNNNYPDFAVATLSPTVASPILLYRSSLKVNVNFTMVDFPGELDPVELNCDLPNGTKRVCFNITVCFQMSKVLSSDTVNTFKFNYNVAIDDDFSGDSPRVEVNPQTPDSDRNYFNKDITLTMGEYRCEKSLFFLKSDVTEFGEDMYVNVELADSDTPILHQELHPVLNVSSVNTGKLTARRNISLILNCGSDNVCVPEYNLVVQRHNATVYLNDEQEINFNVSVFNNAGEAGLAPRVIVIPSAGVGRKGEVAITGGALSISICESELNRAISCQLKSPIRGKEWVNFTISFHPRANELPLNTTSLRFRFEVPGSLSNQTISSEVVVKVQAKASYSLEIDSIGSNPLTAFDVYNYESAQSSNCSTPLNQSIGLNLIGPVASMRYVVQNSHPPHQGSVIPETRLTIFWPYKVKPRTVNESEACRLLLVPNGIVSLTRCQYFGFDLLKDDSRFAAFYNQNPGSGMPVSEAQLAQYCSEGTACEIIQCSLPSLSPGESQSVTIHARLWSYTIVQNLNVTLSAIVESLSPDLDVRREQHLPLNVNTAVQEFVVQCANEYIPIVAVFIGFTVFFIIVVLLAFFGFFGQTTMKRKLKEIQDRKEAAASIQAEVDQYEYDETILRERMETPPAIEEDHSLTKPKVISPTSLEFPPLPAAARESSVSISGIVVTGQRQQSPSWQGGGGGGGGYHQRPVVYLARTGSVSPTREETEL